MRAEWKVGIGMGVYVDSIGNRLGNGDVGVGNAHGSVAGGPGVRSVVHSEGMIATTSRTSSRPVYCV